MKWIIKNLKRNIKHTKRMLYVTPPTSWKGSDKAWIKKEMKKIADMRSAVKILSNKT